MAEVVRAGRELQILVHHDDELRTLEAITFTLSDRSFQVAPTHPFVPTSLATLVTSSANVSISYVNIKPLSCIQEPGSLCAGSLISNHIIVILGNMSVILRLHLILTLTFILILQVAHRFNEFTMFQSASLAGNDVHKCSGGRSISQTREQDFVQANTCVHIANKTSSQ
jgi:hypothetical protein